MNRASGLLNSAQLVTANDELAKNLAGAIKAPAGRVVIAEHVGPRC